MGRCSIRSKKFKQRLEERFSEKRSLILSQKEIEYKNKKIVEEEKKFQETVNSLKFDWRSDLFPQEDQQQVKVNEEIKVKVPEKLKSNWREEIQKVTENIISVDQADNLNILEKDLFEIKPFIKNKNISPEVYERWYQSSNWREEFIDEAMTSKDFKYLYGLSIYDLQITSVLGSTQDQNTQAQDIVQASSDTTDYQFGPQFPGSFVNVIGDPVTSELSPEEKPDSTAKVDAVARISPGDTDSETKKDWGGDQDGAVLPSDPWNYNPTPIVADGEDYEQIIRARFTSDDSPQIKVYSINLSANQTYTFKVLDHVNGESIPGLTWNGYGWDEPGYNANFNTDSVLSLQDANGNVVAQNDDLFPGTYNQYVASNPGDTYPEGPGGEPEYYDGFGWTSAPINYNTTEVPGDESEWYYILNSNISFTPTQSGTYYLAVRDYFNSTAGWNDGPVPTSNYYKIVVRGAAPADSQGGPPTEKPGGSTQDTTAAWDLGGPVSAFLANPESKDKLKSKTLELSDFKSAQDYYAFKAGGGNAALAQGKTLSQVIAQGRINLGGKDQQDGLGVLGGAATAAGALVGNFSKTDLLGKLNKGLGSGYDLKIVKAGKGDHYQAQIIDKKTGKVMTDTTGKPYNIGGGIRGKDVYSNSMMGTLTNAINDIKRQNAPSVQTQPAKVTTTTTKTVKGTPTKSGSRMQPAPTERTTIKSMPASMMGKPARGGGGGSSMVQPIDPFDYPSSDPLSGYTWDKKSGRYLANSYIPYVNRIKSIIRENNKMKSFKQFSEELYPGQPSPNGFPDQPPPETINGWHPEYGKRGKMYNTLDKTSAMSMPLTGNPDIDGKILKARKNPK